MKVIRVFQALVYVAVMALFFISAGRVEAQSKTVRVISVKCVKATLGSDTDEIYVSFTKLTNGKFAGNTKFPKKSGQRIKKGRTWNPNRAFTFGSESIVKLGLWEYDLLNIGIEGIGSDDLIGKITITQDTPPGLQTLVWTGDGSHYLIQLEIK